LIQAPRRIGRKAGEFRSRLFAALYLNIVGDLLALVEARETGALGPRSVCQDR
jgi:hypothetical protein